MKTLENSTENQGLLSVGEKVGLAAAAVAVTALVAWTKLDPEGVRSFAENALTFFGVEPLFDNPLVTPRRTGHVSTS